ncbi:MAG: hypothetical protein Q4P71_08320 [Actinomycetaceae bacterium]|nr:hypothetical protein [Actinomycetaceae bacterium]
MNKRIVSTAVIGGIEALAIVFFPVVMPNKDALVAGLLIGIPSILLFVGVFAGLMRNPVWIHPLVVLLATAVLVLWHLNSSAWIYMVAYAGASLIGVFIGTGTRKLIADARENQ